MCHELVRGKRSLLGDLSKVRDLHFFVKASPGHANFMLGAIRTAPQMIHVHLSFIFASRWVLNTSVT